MARSAAERAHLQLVRDVYDLVLQPLDPRRVDDFFAPDYIQHSPLAATGAQGLKDFLTWARTASPLAEHRVKRLFVDGEHVIAHVHVIIEPNTAGHAVIDIFRIENGKIAEHWDAAQPIPTQIAHQNGIF